MKIVIRAGGGGTRLWPISRRNNPKQFQKIIGEKSLICNTVERVEPLFGSMSNLFISVNAEMVGRLKREIPKIFAANIIAEPAIKNTGPAICLESAILAKRFGEEAIVASLPSDDYVKNSSAFRDMLKAAEKFLENNPEYIVTPGAKASFPDTGYSYIKSGKKIDGTSREKIFSVSSWVEKPTMEQSLKLIKSGKYFHHMGMYVWKLKTVLDLFRKFQPEIYRACREICGGRGIKRYLALEKITVESAITKKSKKLAMIISDRMGWSDLGKWHIISGMLPSGKNGNTIVGQAITVETKNCLIYGPHDKIIATVGLEDMVIAQSDDALLVCPKEKSGEVKKIIEELEKRKLKKFI
jgi:mannose-1-phosphate guanylyltransferase